MEKYEKRIEREAKSGAMRYYRLKASGICVKCGCRKADCGVRCTECAEKAKRQKKERETYVFERCTEVKNEIRGSKETVEADAE